MKRTRPTALKRLRQAAAGAAGLFRARPYRRGNAPSRLSSYLTETVAYHH